MGATQDKWVPTAPPSVSMMRASAAALKEAPNSVVHEPSGLESFESGGASSPSPLESLGGSSLGGRRCCVGAVVVRQAQLHTEQEKIFTGVVDTWRGE